MARNSAINLDVRNNADGFQLGGGTTARVFTVTAGGDLTLTSQQSSNITIPNYAATTLLAYHDLGAKGDIISASAANTPAILNVGSDGQFLKAASGETSGLIWSDVDSLAWVEETTTSRSLAVGEGVIANNAADVEITLPATAAIGSVFAIAGVGAGGWSLLQQAGQTVHMGNQSSTTGAGGSVSSTQQRDCIWFICVTANTDFQVINAIGNVDLA